MFIKNIEISGIRNLKEETKYSFINGKNLICGLNGSGKTSVLESIFILGYGKSFLNVKRDEVLNEDSTQFYARSEVNNLNGNVTINYLYNGDFSILLNGKKIKITDVVNYFFPVFFSSSNYFYFIENRSYTRKMINRFLYGVDNLFTQDLIGYGKILRQKRSLLKNGGNFSQLSVWNRLMSEKIVNIVKKRSEFIDELNLKIKKKKNFGNLNLKYSSFAEDCNGDLAVEKIFNKIEQLKKKEMEYGRVLAGSHMDKIEIFLNGRPLKYFSSGEKKINLIVIYLAYIELFKKYRDEYPLFLIDDYDVAMDHNNIKVMSDNYPEMQVIATSVNRNGIFDNIIDINSNSA